MLFTHRQVATKAQSLLQSLSNLLFFNTEMCPYIIFDELIGAFVERWSCLESTKGQRYEYLALLACPSGIKTGWIPHFPFLIMVECVTQSKYSDTKLNMMMKWTKGVLHYIVRQKRTLIYPQSTQQVFFQNSTPYFLPCLFYALRSHIQHI